QSDSRVLLEPRCNTSERIQLGCALQVEKKDAGFQSGFHFGDAFADAGEDHGLAGGSAQASDALQLAAGNHVKPTAERRQQLQDSQIGIRLYRITDCVVLCGKGSLKRLYAL